MSRNSLLEYAEHLTKGDHFLAEDIMQEALMEAFSSFEKQKEIRSIQSWLRKRIRYRYIKFMRKRSNTLWLSCERILETSLGLAVNEEDKFVQSERYEILRQQITKLPENQKQVIYNFYFREMSVAETAEAMGIGVASVKSMLFLARKKLEKWLKCKNETSSD